jgi:hypothetical protein
MLPKSFLNAGITQRGLQESVVKTKIAVMIIFCPFPAKAGIYVPRVIKKGLCFYPNIYVRMFC